MMFINNYVKIPPTPFKKGGNKNCSPILKIGGINIILSLSQRSVSTDFPLSQRGPGGFSHSLRLSQKVKINIELDKKLFGILAEVLVYPPPPAAPPPKEDFYKGTFYRFCYFLDSPPGGFSPIFNITKP